MAQKRDHRRRELMTQNRVEGRTDDSEQEAVADK